MEKMFSTVYLVAGEENGPVLSEYRGKINPGHQVELNDQRKVLIAGGFPDLIPDSSLPLSPTLQLNRDMTTCSEEALQTIAEAEYLRQQSLHYHSYIVEPDYRVCVIAADSAALDKFIESYGGILEIEPLLIAGSHPDYSTASELHFEQKGSECLVSYRKRSPLKKELCTYCGACGESCPEQCISPQLFIDFDKCSFCKECEKVCKANALDIAGVEEIVLHAPAVVLLGEMKIELPENSTTIFHEEQLSKYFKTLYSAEIKEVVCHNNNICQYSGKHDAGCSRCVVSCPYGAITKGESGISVDHILCEECGNCVSACPTGAMQNGYFTDSSLLQYLRTLPISQSSELVLGSEKELHTLWWHNHSRQDDNVFYLEYSSLQFLSNFHLLLFFAFGFRKVTLLSDENSQNSLLSQEVAKANAISSNLFDIDIAQISTLAEFAATVNNKAPHPLPSLVEIDNYDNRRAALAQILSHLITEAGKPFINDKNYKDFLSISCEEKGCTHCFACLNECKTRALQTDEEQVSLTYQAGACVGCGVCVQVCPEKVLSLGNNRIVDQQFFTRVNLAQSEPARCRECGKVYGSKKSLEKVLQILSAKEAVDETHFEYCSDCRVIKLFEAHES